MTREEEELEQEEFNRKADKAAGCLFAGFPASCLSAAAAIFLPLGLVLIGHGPT